jgi:hypothetical protein
MVSFNVWAGSRLLSCIIHVTISTPRSEPFVAFLVCPIEFWIADWLTTFCSTWHGA